MSNRYAYNRKRAKYGRGPDLGAMSAEQFDAHLAKVRAERIARESALAERALAEKASNNSNNNA